MTTWTAREHHRFEAAGQPFVYLVPSAAIFALDAASDAVLRTASNRACTRDDLSAAVPEDADLDATLAELLRVQAIGQTDAPPVVTQKIIPLAPFPLTTMVLNVTNQCNLSCTYCYEYGEDKIVDTENGRQPKFMTEETARASVDFMLKESGSNKLAHITFFGGETLLNFPVLARTVAYARERAAEAGKDVDFSLTTNATLLKPEIIDFLAEERIGVTISIDGPRDLQDKFRVFHNGAGSYDVVAPKIKELLARHRSRPIGARVTLTSATLDIKRIYRHLTEEMGFWEVGFAPVTTSPTRGHAISDGGYDHMLGQFRDLAYEFLEASVANRHHGFSNVKETLEELHKGVSKAYPCGAGLGLLGVATDGQVALCHRFAGSESHGVGTVHDGIDRHAQQAFLEKHHIANKTDCSVCWARPLCAGGCYHEAHTRYGDTGVANLHYCDWIRGWTDVCLTVYGELAVRNPSFLTQFDHDDMVEKAG
ncbi:MAG TPA: quinohemoprotein amine dehydrogenase maturation protein [Vicinamibacterales bacterium]|jgi:uncharacterized protein